MAKHFFMQYVPGDWLSDAQVSQCRPATRGIWWDAISAMHGIDRCGQLSGTIEALARVCRCRVDEVRAAVDDLRSTGAADVTVSNGIVTLVNRRMRREYENRQAVKSRVDRHRRNKKQRERNAASNASDTDMQHDNTYMSEVKVKKNISLPRKIPSPQAVQLAQKLREAIAARDPRASAARKDHSSAWAKDIDKLLTEDNRKPDEVAAAIAWSQQRFSFWGPFVLSGRKLREKFDTIAGQMVNDRHGGHNGTGAKELGTGPNEPPGSTLERRTSRGERIYIPRQ
jgi:excinuclease UvrABC ATPase subunit